MPDRPAPTPDPAAFSREEWFAREHPDGLSFGCTMCGNCCSGPPGYVIVNDDEVAALAKRLGLSIDLFLSRYTHHTSEGRSLNEVQSPRGLDCVFLDRVRFPGKAVCGVYEDRPRQCRTWPFWPSVLASKQTWERAKRTCPGIDTGTRYTLQQIRVLRDSCSI